MSWVYEVRLREVLKHGWYLNHLGMRFNSTDFCALSKTSPVISWWMMHRNLCLLKDSSDITVVPQVGSWEPLGFSWYIFLFAPLPCFWVVKMFVCVCVVCLFFMQVYPAPKKLWTNCILLGKKGEKWLALRMFIVFWWLLLWNFIF